jgi:hypothetical protein
MARTLSRLRRDVALDRRPKLESIEHVRGEGELYCAVSEFLDTMDKLDAARAALEQQLKCATTELRRGFARLTQNSAVREALATTSPDFFAELRRREQGASIAKRPGDTDRGDRFYYRRLAFYLQRGAIKTHVASRLGTVCFATFNPKFGGHSAISSINGQDDGDGLGRRHVFISYWAVRALSEVIGEDPAIAVGLRPTLAPNAQLLATKRVRLHLQGCTIVLDPIEAAVLRSCDGERDVEAIATKVRQPTATVLDLVRRLEKSGCLARDLVPPATVFDPMDWLTEKLQSLPDTPPRQAWLDRLAELERLRAAYEAAATDGRPEIQEKIEDLFVRCSHSPARRAHGKTYGDRLIFYEECSSNLTFQFGKPLIERLERDLGPALEICFAYGSLWRDHYRALVRQALSTFRQATLGVPFCDLVTRLQSMGRAGQFSEKSDDLVAFEATWNHVVHDRETASADGIARLREEDVKQLAALASPRFRGGHATVDLFIDAASEAALSRGDYRFVVGEVGENVMAWGSQFYFHCDRQQVEDRTSCAIKRGMDYRPLAIILPERTHKGFVNQAFARHNRFIAAIAPSASPCGADLPLRDLRVFLENGEPALGCPRGGRYQFFHHHDDLVHLWAFAAPRIMIPPLAIEAGRTPRIEIGSVCLQRAQGAVETAPLVNAIGTPAQFALLLRQEQRRLRLPQHVFVHCPDEPKPFFVDLGSPISLETAAYLCRKSRRLRWVEMLPSPDGLWLRRLLGRHCLELRVLLVRHGVEHDV